MEMSVGTIVTIVLLMTVLILGLVLVRGIFFSAETSIDEIDKAVKGEINKLFSEDSSKKIVVYPSTRKIDIQKGSNDLGFGFSIRNVGTESAKISYTITAKQVADSCPMTLSDAEDLITLGRKGDATIEAGNILDQPIFVRFAIPESAPPCQIRYSIEMEKGSQAYGSSVDVDLEILSK